MSSGSHQSDCMQLCGSLPGTRSWKVLDQLRWFFTHGRVCVGAILWWLHCKCEFNLSPPLSLCEQNFIKRRADQWPCWRFNQRSAWSEFSWKENIKLKVPNIWWIHTFHLVWHVLGTKSCLSRHYYYYYYSDHVNMLLWREEEQLLQLSTCLISCFLWMKLTEGCLNVIFENWNWKTSETHLSVILDENRMICRSNCRMCWESSVCLGTGGSLVRVRLSPQMHGVSTSHVLLYFRPVCKRL